MDNSRHSHREALAALVKALEDGNGQLFYTDSAYQDAVEILSQPAGPSETPVKVLYVATAYRWGWENEHQYTVYVGPDKAKALALAANEPEYRGGKYGCQVMEWAEDKDGEQESKQVGYFPSIYDEKRLHHNWRLDYFKRLGHVLDNAADGSVWLPEDHPDMKDRDGNPMRVLKPHDITPPDWLVAERNRAKEFSDAMTKHQEERYATDGTAK